MKYTNETIRERFKTGEDLKFKSVDACSGLLHREPFMSNGVTYCCTGQYVAAELARRAGDEINLQRILDASDKEPQKKRQNSRVPFTNDQICDYICDSMKETPSSVVYDIVVEAQLVKARKNKEYRNKLILGIRKVLIDTTIGEIFWGIGNEHSWTKKDMHNPKCWKGENLYGFALMEARDILNETEQDIVIDELLDEAGELDLSPLQICLIAHQGNEKLWPVFEKIVEEHAGKTLQCCIIKLPEHICPEDKQRPFMRQLMQGNGAAMWDVIARKYTMGSKPVYCCGCLPDQELDQAYDKLEGFCQKHLEAYTKAVEEHRAHTPAIWEDFLSEIKTRNVKVSIVRSAEGVRGLHHKFSLRIEIGEQWYYPKFLMPISFALYIFYLRHPGKQYGREDFMPSESMEAVANCEELMAIRASIGQNLSQLKGTNLEEAAAEAMAQIERLQENRKNWQNYTNCNTKLIQALEGEEAEPFLLQPVQSSVKSKRWLDIDKEVIAFDDSFEKAYRENLEHITGRYFHLSFDKKSTILEKNKNLKSMEKGKSGGKSYSCIGAGQYNYDTIYVREYPEGFEKGKKNKYVDYLHTQEVGGTCGNVMCMLGYYGWHAMPLAKLDTGREMYEMKRDLEKYGCDVRYVTNTPDGGSAIWTVVHRLNKEGEHEMGHRGTGSNGSMHISRKSLRVKDEVPAFLAQLEEAPDVFFFDENEAGSRALAGALRERGSFVYYECEGFGRLNDELTPEERERELQRRRRLFRSCVEVADVVKFSAEHIQDLSMCEGYKDKLFIQTRGAAGMRFSLHGGAWIEVPPMPVEKEIDFEGCGDTTSSTFLYLLGNKEALSRDRLTEEIVKEALEEAAKAAAMCTQYYGSKGWIHNDPNFKLGETTVASPYEDVDVTEALAREEVRPQLSPKELSDIPAKDIRKYDIENSMVYFSGEEMLRGVKQVMKKGQVSVLSNIYECPLEFDGMKFMSAEQLYHYFRYRETPIVQQLILQCTTGAQVKELCSGFKYLPANHLQTRWRYMTLAMEVKYLQCKEFRDKLEELEDIDLVESTPEFDIFGSTVPGSHKNVGGVYGSEDVSNIYIGMNGCGRCMMAVRDKFRGWSEARLHSYHLPQNLDDWWNNSPSYINQLEGMGQDV